MIYMIVRRLSGFQWANDNRRTGVLYLLLIAAVFCGLYILPPVVAAVFGTLTVLVSAIYSIRVLFKLLPQDRLPRSILRLGSFLRFTSPRSGEDHE